MAGGVVGNIIAAVVLFGGHTLNILLATMGVLVHGIRLNTLEFSGHLGLEWSGQPYTPLTRKVYKERA
jgi:V/A-type H+-transporting ATPase subunit I